MLAALNDNSTRAEIGTKTTAAATGQLSAATKEPVRTEDGVLIIDATQIAKTGAQNNVAFSGFIGKVGEAVPTAKAIVVDGRAAVKPDDFTAYFFVMSLRQILPQVLAANVMLGSTRYRVHSGYATQTGDNCRGSAYSPTSESRRQSAESSPGATKFLRRPSNFYRRT